MSDLIRPTLLGLAMLRSRRCTAALLLAMAALGATRGASADEPPGRPVLVEGSWTHHGPRNMLGVGGDRTVILKSGDDWTITFITTLYPSVNDPGGTVQQEQTGPYPVRVEDQELVFTREKGALPARYTFLCSPERLIMPAIVQKAPGRWAFQSESESFSAQCENDPLEIPVGRAGVPGVLMGKGFYSYEEAPRSAIWPPARYLRFLERSDEAGQLRERFRLIFDEYGWPRHEGLLSTGERSGENYAIRVYLARREGR